MHFSFVLTVFFLLLASIVRDEGVSLAYDICNAYLHSNIFIDNSTRISFSKTPALTISCLGLGSQNTLYTKCGHNPLLNCHFSFCFQEMYHEILAQIYHVTCVLPQLIFDLSASNLLLSLILFYRNKLTFLK